MKPERWKQIERFYNAALERKPAEILRRMGMSEVTT
jgi:hypothetical protein